MTYYHNEDTGNLVIVKVGTDGKVVVTNYYGTTALIVDVVGYFTTGPVATVTTPLAVGPNHSLSVRSTGTVFAWGKNTSGQLGDGTTNDNAAGLMVPNLGGVTSVAVGDGHSLALKSDGTLWAWGSDQSGQLGDDDIGEDKSVPVPALSSSLFSAVAAACDHSLALGTDGSVWAFGSNSSGQSGIPMSYTQTQLPVHVIGLSSVRAIAAGCGYSLALDAWGQVWSWGSNAHGELGDGTGVTRSTPTVITSLSGVTSISAGAYHALALKTDSTIAAWGLNDEGQLGDGTKTTRLAPVPVQNLLGVTGIATGTSHSAAVTSSGAAWAWGANDHHQLGNNSTTSSLVPTKVFIDLTGVQLTGMSTTIAAGGKHTIGVSTQFVVIEWGQHSASNTDCIVATIIPVPGTSAITGDSPRLPITKPNPDCDNAVPGVPTFAPLDALGRAHGVLPVHLTYKNLWTGRPWSLPPPNPAGYVSPNSPYFHARAHLLGKVLGGPGNVRENFVTMYIHANSPVMRGWELKVRDSLKNCGEVDYSTEALYSGDNLLPETVVVHAHGTVRSTINFDEPVPNIP